MARNLYQAALNADYPHSSSIDLKLTPFDGDADSLEFFISEVKDLAKIRKWNDQEMLFYAKRSLVGPAYKFLTNISTYTDIKTSNQLFAALRTHFPFKDPHQARQELTNFKRQADESIRHMAHRLDALTHKAYPDASEETRNTIKQEKFLMNIPHSIRTHILQAGIEAYPETVNKAVHLQNCETTNQIISDTSTSPLRNISEELRALKESINLFKEQSDTDTNKCKPFKKKFIQHKDSYFKSHKYNKHKFQHRFNRGSNNQKQHTHPTSTYTPMSQNMSQTATPVDTCQFCNYPGHTVRYCPSFKYKFMPIPSNMHTQNASAPHIIPSTGRPHNIQHQDVTKNETSNLINSSLDPNAPVFSNHPNW